MDTTGDKDELDELVDFLIDHRPQVKLAALQIIEGLAASPEGIDKLKRKLSPLLNYLLRLVPEQKEISEKALNSLVNLSQDDSITSQLLDMHAVGRCMDYIRESACSHPKLLVMLLSNLTISEKGCEHLLQMGQGKLEGLNMAVLLKKFVMGGVMWEEGQEDTYEHVAAILTNVTRIKKARELLLQPGRGLLQALAAQLQSPKLLRKRGASGAIKNCCMSAEADGTLEYILSEVEVLQRILVPINGQEPKEKDDTIRECMADSLLVLASTPQGRKALWAVKAQEALQKGYEYEENPIVCRALEHAAELFIFNNGVEEGGSSEPSAAAEAAGGEGAAAAAAPGAAGGGSTEEQMPAALGPAAAV